VRTAAFLGFRQTATAEVALAGSAFLALALGTSVYLLDRDWSTTLFLSPLADIQPAALAVFGSAGLFLPSLFHAYAFSLLIVLAAPRTRTARVYASVGWFAIAAGLECLQAFDIDPVSGEGAGWPAVRALSGVLHSYMEYGQFDLADLVATAAGCLAAYGAACVLEKGR